MKTLKFYLSLFFVGLTLTACTSLFGPASFDARGGTVKPSKELVQVITEAGHALGPAGQLGAAGIILALNGVAFAINARRQRLALESHEQEYHGDSPPMPSPPKTPN